jgi:hypothetical protein
MRPSTLTDWPQIKRGEREEEKGVKLHDMH